MTYISPAVQTLVDAHNAALGVLVTQYEKKIQALREQVTAASDPKKIQQYAQNVEEVFVEFSQKLTELDKESVKKMRLQKKKISS